MYLVIQPDLWHYGLQRLKRDSMLDGAAYDSRFREVIDDQFLFGF